MHFLRVNVTSYDAVNTIHDTVNRINDVIRTANPFPYTAKFMFVGVRNNKTQQIRRKGDPVRLELRTPRLRVKHFTT